MKHLLILCLLAFTINAKAQRAEDKITGNQISSVMKWEYKIDSISYVEKTAYLSKETLNYLDYQLKEIQHYEYQFSIGLLDAEELINLLGGLYDLNRIYFINPYNRIRD